MGLPFLCSFHSAGGAAEIQGEVLILFNPPICDEQQIRNNFNSEGVICRENAFDLIIAHILNNSLTDMAVCSLICRLLRNPTFQRTPGRYRPKADTNRRSLWMSSTIHYQSIGTLRVSNPKTTLLAALELMGYSILTMAPLLSSTYQCRWARAFSARLQP